MEASRVEIQPLSSPQGVPRNMSTTGTFVTRVGCLFANPGKVPYMPVAALSVITFLLFLNSVFNSHTIKPTPFGVQFYEFGKFIESYIHHHNFGTEQFHQSSKKNSLQPLCQALSHPQPLETTDLFSDPIVCLFQNVIKMQSYRLEPAEPDLFHSA